MDGADTWLVVAILAAEIAFWVLLLLGLCARYLLRLRRTSTALLVSVPIADLVLIVLVALDLGRGADPSPLHGLAAVYLGVSVGFGHDVITRVDAWFAHRFAGAPRPARPPRSGPEKVRYEWRVWLHVLTAWAVAVAGLLLMELASGWSLPTSLEQLSTDPMWSWVVRLTVIAVVWLIAGPGYAAVFRSATADEDSPSRKELV